MSSMNWACPRDGHAGLLDSIDPHNAKYEPNLTTKRL
jgi:hypothetical protein